MDIERKYETLVQRMLSMLRKFYNDDERYESYDFRDLESYEFRNQVMELIIEICKRSVDASRQGEHQGDVSIKLSHGEVIRIISNSLIIHEQISE